ncbi:DUF4921 family protein [Candidatus Bathyarchaeota archaeon]|nr:DUF4921 family protein [Candidatus Bathyarchaeota archaeon]MBS7613122.1 DUF4921 family protein [Candidatus Bathyarchaeota archaeon]MBS7617064.1 DUF4921 family protein [Candidatus Bathyarchaeota archaeon]
MSQNELRKDYILDRWVVIASQRGRRPSDFFEAKRGRVKKTVCPFCPGNEQLTPPATLIYLRDGGGVRKTVEKGGFRHKNWIIRCIPNLYPAFSPLDDQKPELEFKSTVFHKSMKALGFHEVLIESPFHDEHPSTARKFQLKLAINAIKDRFHYLSSRDYVKCISVFRNHGVNAGASLSHPHSQIVAMPILPKIIEEEAKASRNYYKAEGECIFCSIVEEEAKSERFIWENESFIVFAPWAALNPFEFWIFPKRHQSSILETTGIEVENLAETLRVSLSGLKSLLNDPPYNLGFHMLLENHYHWHVEVYPRLTIWAGLEKSTGMFINTVSPEDAAESLKESFKSEENMFKKSERSAIHA